MPSKKLYTGSSILYLFVGGVLTLYILFRVWAKGKKIEINVEGPVTPNTESTPSINQTVVSPTGTQTTFMGNNPFPMLSFSPSPAKANLTYEQLLNWIGRLENVRYTAKKDGIDKDGNPLFSIGYGHQIKKGEEYLLYTTINEQKARELFKTDIEEIVKDVDSVVKVPLNQNQKLALVSIRYNVGPAGFRSRNLVSTLNKYDYSGAAFIIGDFITTSNGGVFNQGLKNRRMKEQALFLKKP
jgi:lysozyme